MDFTEFVDVLAKLPDDIIDRHLRSQSWFLCDEQGLLPDYIGKLENFDADWEFSATNMACQNRFIGTKPAVPQTLPTFVRAQAWKN